MVRFAALRVVLGSGSGETQLVDGAVEVVSATRGEDTNVNSNAHRVIVRDAHWQGLELNEVNSWLLAHTASQSQPRMWIFSGYCVWGWNQLQNELADGKWKVCQACVEDLCDTPHSDLWRCLQQSDRLQSHSTLSQDHVA